MRKHSKPLRVYIGLQEYVLLWSIFELACSGEAPMENGSKGAPGGEGRAGARLSQPAERPMTPAGWKQAGCHRHNFPQNLLLPNCGVQQGETPFSIPNPQGRLLCWGISCRYSFVKQGLVFLQTECGVSWKQPGYF